MKTDTVAGSRPLRELLAPITTIPPADDCSITGVASHSGAVEPGNLFVAIEGGTEDGHAYVGEAVRNGAAAVVTEHEVGETGVPVILVADARRALALIAAEWYGHPARDMTLVGITGTFGKTSILTLLEHILNHAGHRTGAVGSEIVGIRLKEHLDLDSPHTTPDPLRLHHGLRRLADEGADIVCMEVTSHALHQDRVHGLQFAVGIFSNLVAMEHQDYHGSFEDYVGIKLRFCEHLAEGAPLIFGADNHMLQARLDADEHTLVGCGMREDASVVIADVRTTFDGTSYVLRLTESLPGIDGGTLDRQDVPVELHLLGRPHMLNSAFAATAALGLGVEPDHVRQALASFPPPRRRMELIHVLDFHVLDDTAGHPDSVDAVFEVANGLTHRRLHVVAAVRGRRGDQINAQLARAVAAACLEHEPASLTVTDSAETVDEANVVSDDERRAFLDTLQHHGVPFTHEAELYEALARPLGEVEAGDLLVLIGAQGMIQGAELVRKMAGSAAATTRPERPRGTTGRAHAAPHRSSP